MNSQDSQVNSFCFTAFPPHNTPESLEDTLILCEGQLKKTLEASYFVIGREICPTTQRFHLQGYAQLSKKKRFSTIRKSIKGNIIDHLKGSPENNIAYCKKDNNFQEYGKPKLAVAAPGSGSEVRASMWNELIDAAKKGNLDDALTKHPAQAVMHWNKLKSIESHFRNPGSTFSRKNVWIWSKKSGVGKSRWAHKFFPRAYWILTTKFLQGYRADEHDSIVYDDIDKNSKGELRTIKRMSDVYPCTLDVKFGDTSASYTRFIVTSNYEPCEIWNDIDDYKPIYRRFLVVQAIKWDEDEGDLIVRKEGVEFMLAGHLRNFDFI